MCFTLIHTPAKMPPNCDFNMFECLAPQFFYSCINSVSPFTSKNIIIELGFKLIRTRNDDQTSMANLRNTKDLEHEKVNKSIWLSWRSTIQV